MDMLFSKYACPFLLSDNYIEDARFDEFVSEVWGIHNDEIAWDFYLHKVEEAISFDDFLESMKPAPSMEHADFETIIDDSASILENFKLE